MLRPALVVAFAVFAALAPLASAEVVWRLGFENGLGSWQVEERGGSFTDEGDGVVRMVRSGDRDGHAYATHSLFFEPNKSSTFGASTRLRIADPGVTGVLALEGPLAALEIRDGALWFLGKLEPFALRGLEPGGWHKISYCASADNETALVLVDGDAVAVGGVPRPWPSVAEIRVGDPDDGVRGRGDVRWSDLEVVTGCSVEPPPGPGPIAVGGQETAIAGSSPEPVLYVGAWARTPNGTEAHLRLRNPGTDPARFEFRAEPLDENAARATLVFEPDHLDLEPDASGSVRLFASDVMGEARVNVTASADGVDVASVEFTLDQAFAEASGAAEGRARPSELPVTVGGESIEAAADDRAVAIAAAGAAVAGGAVGVALLSREHLRYAAAAPLVGLYTRIAKSETLAHPTREAIHAAVLAEPGLSYSEIRRRFDLRTGAAVHHLATLERQGLLSSRREGARRRYYGVAPQATFVVADALTPAERLVLDALAERPLTQGEVARRLGVTKQAANRHVKALQRRGYLDFDLQDGEWRCRRTEKAPPPR